MASTASAAPKVNARAVDRALDGSGCRSNGGVLITPMGRNICFVMLDPITRDGSGDRSGDLNRAATWLQQQGYQIQIVDYVSFGIEVTA